MFRRLPSGLRAPLRPSRGLPGPRHFSPSPPKFSDIHSEILNILREEPSESTAPAKKKGILILSPEQTKNKEYAKYKESLAKKDTHLRKNGKKAKKTPSLQELDLLTHAAHQPHADVFSSIENFKPGEFSSAAAHSMKSAMSNLASSFTKAQLAGYVRENGPLYYRSSHTKAKLANVIVTQIWGESDSAASNVFMREQIPLSHQEMFLLLSQRGSILRLLKATVTSLDFDSKKQELILVGTESQVQNARINLAHQFEAAVREEIDLSTIQALYEDKFGSFTFTEIGKLIEVYFQHSQGGKYELCALNAAQVKRIKRLLVWFLDYNLHQKKTLHLPESSVLQQVSLLPHADEYSMAWQDRSKAHFRLTDEKNGGFLAGVVAREMAKFSDAKLEKVAEQTDYDVSREFFESGVSDETYENLRESGVLADESLEDVIEDIAGPKKGEEHEEIPGLSSLLSDAQKTRIYSELVDFSYRKALRGVADTELDTPMFTVTLGRVLFQKEKAQSSVLTVPPEAAELAGASPDFTFSTNIPSAYDKVLHEGLGETDSVYSDPHTYSLQFKFLPSPYVEDGDSNDHMKYPPMEMWMQLNENKVVDIESLQLVTVEGENDSYVCLPQCGSDLKISCQMTGSLIEDVELEDFEKSADSDVHSQASDLGALFDQTSSKYPRLSGQKGVQTFLEESKLNFSGKSPTSIAPFVDIVIDNTVVRYAFVSVNYRREFDVEIAENQTVQLSVVDGGSLGGRRAEVRFIGDFESGLERAAFDSLMDHTCGFVGDL